MPQSNPVTEVLRQGPLLLSGGLGTELLRRGHPTPLPLWSTAPLLDAPEAVRGLHADYVRAGARLVTANTFRTGRATVAPHGHDPRALTRRAVELARAGIEDAAIGRRVLVAGSLAPVADCFRPDLVPDEATLRAEHGLHVGALVAARVDLVLIETMNTIREATTALAAARAGLLPAIVSFTLRPDGTLHSGESLADAVAAAEPFAPCAVLVNCCAPATATAAVRALAGMTTRPFGAYANGSGGADGPDGWCFADEPDDGAYVAEARAWLRAGASLVGGCCGTGPTTIRALADLIASQG
ncbi:MAG: homocysteine S-methyltransferase family protein [Planctomycetota bacterium]|nr:homocysteine S-methyltransferase family protein [Planctomycetota bacterium]